jgi:dienelactone hydrolase
MPAPATEPDPLDDFDCRELAFAGQSYDVYVAGAGPAVLVLPEIPGITPEVADCARRLIDAGFSVWVPSLFGEPGRPLTQGWAVRTMAKACVDRTFRAFARAERAPIIDYLRALGEHAQSESGGEGIGVIGMCFTGNFALVLAIDERVKLPVMSQPSLPLGPLPSSREALAVAPDDLATIKGRAADEHDALCVIGLRFTRDPFVPSARFRRLERELGDAFLGVEIDSGKGNEYGFGVQTHSVLTTEYSDEPGHPTNDAWNLVVSHLSERLPPS